MKKVLIIGAGFAGLAAAERLSGHKDCARVTLIDEKPVFDFLPLLPDCLGRGINPQYLSFKISDFTRKKGPDFLNARVSAINTDRSQVVAAEKTIDYDYLIIASGSRTNFYGNKELENSAFKLDSASDAEGIRSALSEREFDSYIISGGGYTGIEVATNLRAYLNKKKRNKRIVIIERAPSILGPLPEWMKEYARDNLKILNIEVLVNTVIDKVESGQMLIWTAGVRTSDFIQDLDAEKNPQGRIKADKYLRLNEHCFVAGDACWFADQGNFLRMTVQFSIMQGRVAAENLIRSIRGTGLLEFRPRDLGYIIPMANNYSCGKVLAMDLKGRLPTLLHYLVCIYRSRGLRNKFGVLKNLLKGG
ncbi:MAG: FAD-dependent oxidoreductase [Candidatus Omnitrophota bacterium]|nr:FAD-dependent oxidoreductase [Candidatus Omnitrophota bacterium]